MQQDATGFLGLVVQHARYQVLMGPADQLPTKLKQHHPLASSNWLQLQTNESWTEVVPPGRLLCHPTGFFPELLDLMAWKTMPWTWWKPWSPKHPRNSGGRTLDMKLCKKLLCQFCVPEKLKACKWEAAILVRSQVEETNVATTYTRPTAS